MRADTPHHAARAAARYATRWHLPRVLHALSSDSHALLAALQIRSMPRCAALSAAQFLENHMLKYAIIFAIISLIAGAFGFTGIAAGSAGIAKILFYIFLVIAVVFIILAVLGVGAARKALK